MSYNPILDAETNARKPGTSSLFKRLVANPLAIFRGETNSPMNEWGWHPYNKASVGDGNDGLIYDRATMPSPTEPLIEIDVEDGYSYSFYYENFYTTADLSLGIQGLRKNAGTLTGFKQIGSAPANQWSGGGKPYDMLHVSIPGAIRGDMVIGTPFDSISKIRFIISGYNQHTFSQGRVYAYRQLDPMAFA